MIYKAYSSTVEDLDQKGRVLVAANAIGNTDSDGDISMPGSFDETLKADFGRLRWFLNHDKNTLLGVPLSGTEKDNQLQMLGQLNLDKQVSRDVYADYKLMAEHGRSLEHSIGVIARKRNAKDAAKVEKWQLHEYSTLTHWGANSETPMLGIKSHKGLDLESIEERINWMELQLKKGDYTDDKFRRIEIKLKDLLKIIGSASNEEDAVTEPKIQETHQVEPVAFNPTRLKAAHELMMIRDFNNKLKTV
jgi:HK97 family phage prohead protease